jgi:ketosteroid isomerase-like protein
VRSAEEFVDAFERFWRMPSVNGLDELLSHDAVLRQPLGPTTRDLATGKRAFARIFAAIPDLHAVVDRWGATRDGVLIEFRLMGTVGGRPIEWPVVDRFVLQNGSATERVSYFNPTPLLRASLTRPTSWWRLLRSRL